MRVLVRRCVTCKRGPQAKYGAGMCTKCLQRFAGRDLLEFAKWVRTYYGW